MGELYTIVKNLYLSQRTKKSARLGVHSTSSIGNTGEKRSGARLENMDRRS